MVVSFQFIICEHKYMIVLLGTFPDEEDIVAFTSTGDSDHVYFNNIPFVPGKSYQATVKGKHLTAKIGFLHIS